MRQRLLSHLTYANVISTLCLFLLLGGGTAVALTGSNTVFSDDIVDNQVFSSDVRNDTLTGGGLGAADLKPSSVGTSEVALNSLTGSDINESSLTGNVRRLNYNAAPSNAAPTNIATVGPYTIKGVCLADGSYVYVRLFALGPAGTADVMYDQVADDTTDLGTKSNGLLIPANANTMFAASQAPKFDLAFRRMAGTAMLKSGSVLVQVVFNAVADARSLPGSCFIYGTATRAT